MSDFEVYPDGSPRSAREPKRDLRSKLIADRRAKSAEELKLQDALVRVTVAAWLTDRRPGMVAAYVPMAGEPGGPELPETIAGVAPRLILPVVQPDRDLDWSLYGGPESLTPATFGLLEPTGDRLGVEAVTDAAVIIVPALAVDQHGVRLGRGGGSYDRALARVRPPQLVIALLYPGELHTRLPREPHDRRVDGVIVDGHVTMLSAGHSGHPGGR